MIKKFLSSVRFSAGTFLGKQATIRDVRVPYCNLDTFKSIAHGTQMIMMFPEGLTDNRDPNLPNPQSRDELIETLRGNISQKPQDRLDGQNVVATMFDIQSPYFSKAIDNARANIVGKQMSDSYQSMSEAWLKRFDDTVQSMARTKNPTPEQVADLNMSIAFLLRFCVNEQALEM